MGGGGDACVCHAGVGGGPGPRSLFLEILDLRCLLDIQVEISLESGVVHTGDINLGLVSK